jgi:hypothetical protein
VPIVLSYNRALVEVILIYLGKSPEHLISERRARIILRRIEDVSKCHL